MDLACLAAWRMAPAATAAATIIGHRSSRRLPLLCRAAASKAAKAAKPEEVYTFERAPNKATVFPELLQPGRRAVLLAVDPDLGGAVAALTWLNPPALPAAKVVASDSNCSSTMNSSDAHAPQRQAPQLTVPPLDQIAVELHDMPIEIWKYGRRNKRQPEANGLIHILQRYVNAAAGGGLLWDNLGGSSGTSSSNGCEATSSNSSHDDPAADPTATNKRRKQIRKKVGSELNGAKTESPACDAEAAAAEAAVDVVDSGGESRSSSTATRAAAAGAESDQAAAALVAAEGEPPPMLRAVIEYSMPPHASGKFAWFGIGFAVGLLNGLLTAQSIPYYRVSSSTWKQAMGLKKQGKGASIALARDLLPSAAIFLKRKKDHGRAEALLMAAWGLGIRMQPIMPGSNEVTSTDEEDTAEADEDAREEEDTLS